MTVEERLRQLFPLAKRMTLKEMVRTGRVRLGKDGPAAHRINDEVPAGTELHVMQQAPAAAAPPQHGAGTHLDIVFEDADVLIVNKPAGLLTSTVPHEPRPTLLGHVTAYLERTAPRARVGLIHRLDKDARGLLVFTKNEDAYASLKAQLKVRDMGREYHAIVMGTPNPAAGHIESRLVERKDGRVQSSRVPGKGELASTEYSTLRQFKDKPTRTLLQVRLNSGRKHQIRVHFAERSHPIIGDSLYGAPGQNRPPLLLAATRLTFSHPRSHAPVEFTLPLPTDFT